MYIKIWNHIHSCAQCTSVYITICIDIHITSIYVLKIKSCVCQWHKELTSNKKFGSINQCKNNCAKFSLESIQRRLVHYIYQYFALYVLLNCKNNCAKFSLESIQKRLVHYIYQYFALYVLLNCKNNCAKFSLESIQKWLVHYIYQYFALYVLLNFQSIHG